jgi:hypothetical protein
MSRSFWKEAVDINSRLAELEIVIAKNIDWRKNERKAMIDENFNI